MVRKKYTHCIRNLYLLYGKKTKKMEQEIDTNELGESIVKVLKSIYDPEIPVDIYELGLIYDVMVNTDFEVKILMTLTSPNCPVAESLPREVEEKVKTIENIKMYALAFDSKNKN